MSVKGAQRRLNKEIPRRPLGGALSSWTVGFRDGASLQRCRREAGARGKSADRSRHGRQVPTRKGVSQIHEFPPSRVEDREAHGGALCLRALTALPCVGYGSATMTRAREESPPSRSRRSAAAPHGPTAPLPRADSGRPHSSPRPRANAGQERLGLLDQSVAPQCGVLLDARHIVPAALRRAARCASA